MLFLYYRLALFTLTEYQITHSLYRRPVKELQIHLRWDRIRNMLERLLDILVVKPEIDHLVTRLGEEGFAIACSTGLKSDGAFHRPLGERWWEDVGIYDMVIPHYESQLPPHRRSYLTDKRPAPFNKEPFNEIPVARILVSRARLDGRGVVVGYDELGRLEIHLHDPYFGNDPQMLKRLKRAADKASVFVWDLDLAVNQTKDPIKPK